MEVVVLQVFVSLALVAGGVLLFVWRTRARDHEHGERLSLLPIDDERSIPTATRPDQGDRS